MYRLRENRNDRSCSSGEAEEEESGGAEGVEKS